MVTESVETATYTVPQVAKILGIGERTAYEQAEEGAIPSLKIGARRVVPKALLEKFLAGEWEAPSRVPAPMPRRSRAAR